MNAIIFAEPFAHPPLFAAITGTPLEAQQLRPVLVRDAALTEMDHVPFPAVQLGQADMQLAGRCVVNLPAAAQGRITYFAAVCGCELQEVPALIDGQEGMVTAITASGGRPNFPVTLDRWMAEAAPMMTHAAQEIMGYMDRFSPIELHPRLGMILARAAARQMAQTPAPTKLRSSCDAERVSEVAAETTHTGFFTMRRFDLSYPHFDGSNSPRLSREVFVATDAAVVLPYDATTDQVLLVEQFRMGPYGRGDTRPWTLEPVAGRVDALESPETCARRECQEEAGLILHNLEHINSHYCSPGASTEFYHCYLGLCDLAGKAGGNGGLESEDEDIRTHILPFDQAMDLVTSGEANTGPLVLCLLWLQRERARLRGAA